MKDLYECGSCGVIAESSATLCEPHALSGRNDYCGTAPKSDAMCDTMREALEYECGGCGRPVESPAMVCTPVKRR